MGGVMRTEKGAVELVTCDHKLVPHRNGIIAGDFVLGVLNWQVQKLLMYSK